MLPENNDLKRVIADEGLMIIMRISDIFVNNGIEAAQSR